MHHGHSFSDPYEWMRDKRDPEVIAHLEAENAFTADQTAHLTPVAEEIFGEILGRTQETDLSVPVRRGAFWYFTRTTEGQSYGRFCRVPVTSDDDWTPPEIGDQPRDGEEIVIDSNIEAEGQNFFSLGGVDISADGTLAAWASDVTGDERYTVRVRTIASGVDSAEDLIEGTAGHPVFSPDARDLYYCTVDDAWRPDTVWRHRLGTRAADDEKIFTEPDERYWVGVGRTRSRRYLVISVGSKITSEVHLLDTTVPGARFEAVWPRVDGVEYDVEHAVVAGRDRLLITHNAGAVNFELVDVAADDPLGERTVVIPHSNDSRLEGVDAFADHLVVSYRRDVLTRVGIIPLSVSTVAGQLDGFGALREVDFDEPLFDVGPASTPEWSAPAVRIAFSSFVTPMTVLDLDLVSGAMTVLKRQPVLGGYRSEDYTQARDWAVAADGERIPVSLVWRTGLVREGEPAPLLLYGYGSYEASIDPTFSIPRLSLLDRGMVFAVAHVRGGGELGRRWYDAGKTLTKTHDFHRLRLRCAPPDRHRPHGPRPPRRRRSKRRRAAHGSGGEPRAGSVRRHPRRGAVRRRAHKHPRP